MFRNLVRTSIVSLTTVSILIYTSTFNKAEAQRPSGNLTFVGDPNLTGNLSGWDHIQVGGTALKVSQYPKGINNPGTVIVVPDPLGIMGLVYKLTVTPYANFAASSAMSDRVDLCNYSKDYLGQEGQENWEHLKIMFPSGNDSYNPAPGSWNWLLQHHNGPKYKEFIQSGVIKSELPELVWGVDTKMHLPDETIATELFMQVRGGDDMHQGHATRVYPDAPLLYDHWYDMMVHEIWSHDPERGLVEWWLDGKQLFSRRIANLWQRPDGSIDRVNFELSNYRIHADTNSTVYFSKVKILTR